MPHKLMSKRPWQALVAAVVVAVLATVIAQPPASAVTNQFKGVNWADTRDSYSTGWVIPDSLNSADSYIRAFQKNLGANTVRLPINPPSVSQAWWNSYRAVIDAALADGMVTNMPAWQAMWATVVARYGGNGNVYFEPLNEPFGYSLSRWVSICDGMVAAQAGEHLGQLGNQHGSRCGSSIRLGLAHPDEGGQRLGEAAVPDPLEPAHQDVWLDQGIPDRAVRSAC